MGEKDIGEKLLESYDDVFADIVNVLLFHGERKLSEAELEEQAPREGYKADGKLRETERDVIKRWKRGELRIASIGIENQSDPDAVMPLRVLAYDGAEYRAQLLKGNPQKVLYPIVTIVLYFGYENEWKQKLTLKECLNIPDELQPYVNDYRINLFRIAFLEQEQVEQFQSDFRVVADYFVQMRKTRDYVPTARELKHVQETLQLLSIMTNDHRFEEVCNEEKGSREGGPKNMCEVLDRIENRGIEIGIKKGIEKGIERGMEKGIEEGLERGKKQGMLTTLVLLVRDGLITVQEAAKRAQLTVPEFEARARELQMQ